MFTRSPRSKRATSLGLDDRHDQCKTTAQMRHALWLVVLVGCLHDEIPPPVPPPPGPLELELVGDLDVVTYHHRQQPPTPTGGTQTFHVHYAGTIPGIPGPVFDLPYTAVAADDRLQIDDQHGTSITIRGAAPGQGTVRFLDEDGASFAERGLAVAELQSIKLEPVVSERLPSTNALNGFDPQSIAWAPGAHRFRVGLYGPGRLGDSSMAIGLPGAERTSLDELHVPGATVGSYPIAVTAAGRPTTTVDFVVVDRADSVALITSSDPAPTSFEQGRITSLCFEARSAGRYIVGVDWAFTIVGEVEPAPHLTPNCISVTPRQASGNITVGVVGAGQALAMTLPVVAR